MAKKSIIPREFLNPSAEFVAGSERLGLYWWHWNNEVRKLFLSPALLKILGYTPEEFDPSVPSVYKNIHPEDAEENLNKIRRLILDEDSLYEIEFRVKDAQGNWQWYYNRGTVTQRDENGKGLTVGGITIDISGQYKQMMAKLQEKEKFEFVFKNTDEAIVILELQEGMTSKVVDANKAALKLFEVRSKDQMVLLPTAIVPEDMKSRRAEFLKQVMEKGSGRVELNMQIGKDKNRWIDITAHTFKHTGKTHVVAVAKDITSGKEKEAERKETERVYRTLFEAADDAIGLFSMDREVIVINSAFYSIFGYEQEEFLEMGFMGNFHPDDRYMAHTFRDRLLREGSVSVDFRAMHKSGEYLHISSKNVLIPGEPGEKDLFLTIMRDVTGYRKDMHELERAKEKAEESDKLKSAFLANMSHEIRTPMNSIVGFSNLLVNEGITDDSRALYVQRIVRNSELLMALISDIIDLAKIESGQLPIVYGKLRISSLVEEMKQYALDELDRIGKTGIDILIDQQSGETEIETDVVRLGQIMKNLVDNAIKFTRNGSVTIGCKRAASDADVILFVEDTGIGIAQENFELIFDQFRQIDGSNTRKFGGTGLGLAICKNLAHMMDGRIWVESVAGEGAIFQVELPVKSARNRGFEEQKEVLSDEASGPGKILSIMVVDDMKDAVVLFCEMLRGLGHTVVTATSGYEALRLLEKSPLPDLVFMDVQMPVLTGTDTMRIMKERFPSIKVVAESAHALVGDRARFLQEGFDAYLPKPFSMEQLTDVLKLFS
ncbi:MAG: PAS domain-containing protein [Bacteroidota bacterium]